MAAFPEESNRFDNIATKAEKNINVYIKTKATVAFGQAVIAGVALYRSISRGHSFGHSWSSYLISYHIWGLPFIRTTHNPGLYPTAVNWLHRSVAILVGINNFGVAL